MTAAEGPGFSPDELRIADDLVISADRLWREFVAELRRYGTIERMDDSGFVFRERHEVATRTFHITAERLRAAFVHDRAWVRSRGERATAITSLPQWFLDELTEFIGSHEEPYGHTDITLVGTQLRPLGDGGGHAPS